MRNDTNCDWETALALAISAKNCFINVSRFSPHQIVIGRNINLPSIYYDKPLADLPQNGIIIEHLSVLHASRQAFIATESFKKLKTALREHFDHGSQIYYEWNGDQEWERPGKVVGRDGAVIIIRHGFFFIKAQCSRILLAHDLENSNLKHQIENIDNSQDEENQKSTQENISNNKVRIDDSDNKSEINEDISRSIVHNSKKSTSINNSSENLNEENTTTLEKLTIKPEAININDNDNESKSLHKIKKGKVIDFRLDNMP